MRYGSLALLLIVANSLNADQTTIGPDGIDATATGLDGSTTDANAPGIEIGQVEPGRSGKPMYGSPPEQAASNTKPAGVYFTTASGMANPTEADDEHATIVAGVMIGDATAGAQFKGVAPKANLHSAAFGSASGDEFSAGGDEDFALTANRIAKLGGAGVRVRAINISTVRALQEPVEHLDGNSFPTQFIDWSARAQDILYTVAWGNNSSSTKRVPTDNYNGMTVATSQQVDPDHNDTAYRKFGSVNATLGQADSPRSSISLIAPGQAVSALGFGDVPMNLDGTSLAAPHVTGTVALLQAYDSKQMLLTPPNPRFGTNSQRHEVMKAVMMNSADKLAGVHGSTRDVLSLDGQNWLHSPAYTDPATPLDPWIGTGELNAKRAVQQLAPGEYDPGMVPSIGWDYQSVGGQNDYVFNQNIGGGYIAATLAWDRKVDSTATCGTTTFCEGD